ncbi:Uncharacterised protein [Actinobacillus seminis]|uniref:Uncharacterized protein n=1 Tax=Actinobacillus seminis TaxID=722 RepID=A0A380VE36_9PAST|nr:Uncharacterised protein [Actinobacillus seminis]
MRGILNSYLGLEGGKLWLKIIGYWYLIVRNIFKIQLLNILFELDKRLGFVRNIFKIQLLNIA